MTNSDLIAQVAEADAQIGIEATDRRGGHLQSDRQLAKQHKHRNIRHAVAT